MHRESRRKIIPTVNASSGPAVEKLLKHFLEFMDLSQDRKRLDSYFCKPPAATNSSSAWRSGIVTPSRSEVSTTATKRIRKGARDNGKLGTATAEASVTVAGEVVARRRVQEEEDENGESIVLPPPPRLRCVGATAAPAAFAAAAVAAAAPPAVSVDVVDVTACSSTAANGITAERETCTSSSSKAAGLAMDSVDVEAQKAILADIERRNKLKSLQPPPEERPKSNETMPTVPNPYATPPVRQGGGGGRGARKTLSGAGAAAGAATSTCDDENRHPVLMSGQGRRGATGRGAKTARTAAPDTGQGSKFGGREGGRALGKGGGANKRSASALSGNSGRGLQVGGEAAAGAMGMAVRREVVAEKSSHSSSSATIRDFFGRNGET